MPGDTERKKKGPKPPKFVHHHPIYAQKLKRQWIEQEKVKAKWRAQKRHDPELQAYYPPIQRGDPMGEEFSSTFIGGEGKDDEDEWQGIQTQETVAPRPSPTSARSLRDLSREAYSPSTLHNFKSGRHNPVATTRYSRPRNGSGAQVQGGGHHSHHGQPNMKLRMNVLLEKIKRNYVKT